MATRSLILGIAFCLGPTIAIQAASLSVPDVVVSQSRCQPHVASFAVRLSPAAQTVTVEYTTADGSAVAGADYTAASGTLTFRHGTRLRFVRVPVADIAVPGPSKTFFLNLSNPTNATLADGQGVATIRPPAFAKCDDSNPCTQDSCDTTTRTCRHVDANACGTAVCALGSCGVDTDGDGLSDAWETNGYVDLNCNGVDDGPAADIPLPGADPTAPDVYVKYDYMATAGHDHNPGPVALEQVVQAFAMHGVALHFLAPDGPIAEHQVTTLDPAPSPACAGDDFVTTHSLRAQNLGNLGLAYHYLVFAHRVTTPDLAHEPACPTDPACGGKPDPGASGSADLPGDDAIVSFGGYIDGGLPIGIETLASTVMHEVGHNFGLKHGGEDACVNYKPNYLSVMNYAYQLNGIPVADGAGSTNFHTCVADADCGPPTVSSGACAAPTACHCTDDLIPILGANICYRVDYSALGLPSLNELSPSPGIGGLDENVGVPGPVSNEDIVLYFAPGPAQLVGASNGSPIDWDNDSAIATHVTADINNDGINTILTTRNDWETSGGLFTNLDFQYQCTPGYGRGAPTTWRTNEIGFEFARQHRLRLPPKPKEPK